MPFSVILILVISVKKIIVIVGPTGVGKTKLSIELAKKLNAEIINADSTQIYKEINIGTAKIEDNEMENIIHHLINTRELTEDYTVYDYQIESRKILENILDRNKTAIIVGGSGLYLSALLYDYCFTKGDNVYDIDSLDNNEMYKTLINKHPDLKIDKHNRQRLIRAYAKHINNSEELTSDNGGQNLLYDCLFIGLTTTRDVLYNKINHRVDKMIEDGLINEVRTLFNKYPTSKQLSTTIGYKEFKDYINGNDYLENVLINIKQNTRNYAKRQYTWLNHKMDVQWFTTDYDNFNNTIKKVITYIKE